ncbi:glycine cleavage system protein R [Marinomonas mediterranea]|uniref:Glycine cleavage system transcriptional repressor n=1 Tax=Marinomonas mediterranea (strain ATCC 700492 / JCM 21426 / NBRC 103028 / MMB-1) TaxID=717774 RepID=F2JWV5_MARM1|nr:ACT domain-containing protein [Marinomonas mediterranea]ADZ92972.1 amino acid-binding ACT domain protein [Marinomonas mediterranea MMB-1]WCN10886.1 glycine cleavage system protein R [Marinomonas mediterranea]WCN14947.1 glycine cleavage system protein R [Marinomonas mediterranea]WCN18991.1 glycine cleavage system protein R [Marinomonas mediterranea MMB-1]
MFQTLVLTVIGEDRPGLVEMLSNVVQLNKGSWKESRMAHLADKFAGIVTVEVEKNEETKLVAALEDLEPLGLKVSVERASVVDRDLLELSIKVIGNDRPGIVKEVSEKLASLQVNVKELSSFCEPAPMSSEMLFVANFLLALPKHLTESDLENTIEEISSDLMVERN